MNASGRRASSSPEQQETTISAERGGAPSLIWYLALGTAFGVVLIKSQVVSWFRIQEMFRFQSFHMYGVMATAVAVAMLSLQLLERFGVSTSRGEPICVPAKTFGRGIRYAVGGVLFGLGWALTGACPGPLFALLGGGVSVYAAAIVAALAGTWLYGLLRSRLPH